MLFTALAVLLVAGFLLWLFNLFVTAIDPRIKTAINGIVLLFVFLYLLDLLTGHHLFAGLTR